MLVDYYVAKGILDRYGIRSVRSRYAKGVDDAVSFWDGKNPIVLKALSQKALHKSKSGLVAVDLDSESGIRNAFRMLQRKAARLGPYNIIAQQMVKNGIEIIIGGNTDPQFGKMVLLGLGGIYVETFRDFALRLCPITRRDAESMVAQLKSSGVIAPDEKSKRMITDLLLKASRMFENTKIAELDLNPVILHDGTYDAVDLRMLK
ncbi:MAG: acetate--CoA ligase family protein [Candidatus Marsarchaeota archaeon]|jgi:acetyl-CoA synthetase (ADP-forming)|nr:acetate--CoA ligase family protein [Candidatus Marsarchaeota archaeon]MCL5111372.1 acetate--CoA ligase family protein [Candidatus Marsarchaeota archaeon]